jgi:L-lactate permease
MLPDVLAGIISIVSVMIMLRYWKPASVWRFALVDAADHPKIAPALSSALGEVRPANTTVVARLIKPEMKVEIEVTAFRG